MSTAVFDPILAGRPAQLVGDDGRILPLVPQCWLAPADGPGEGRWHHVLLADGNLGIGGDPLRLLRRCAALLRRGGTILVETAQPGVGLWRGTARLQGAGGAAGPWFPWAVAELLVLAALAPLVGFGVADRHHGDRCFAEVRRVSGR